MTAQPVTSPPIDRLVGIVKDAMKRYPAIKDRIFNQTPDRQEGTFSDIIQFFEGIDHELQKTSEQLLLPIDEVISFLSNQLSLDMRQLFAEAYGFWLALRQQSQHGVSAKPVRRLPKVSNLRIKI